MCISSTGALRTRRANKGERFTLKRFNGGAVGATDPNEADLAKEKRTAVCILEGTQVEIIDIPQRACERHALPGAARAIHTHVSANSGRAQYDAFQFGNGVAVLWEELRGAKLQVLALPGVGESADFDVVASSPALEPA